MESIYDKIERLRINPLNEINEPPSYCTIDNKPTFTAGNFSLINGKKKAGKTFLLGGMIASVLNNSTQLEVIKGSLPVDKNVVLYFDTEQSQYHANRSIKRICTLISNTDPSNLLAYGLRPLTPLERLQFIEAVIMMTPKVGLVAIDGIRDLLTRGINDEQEATELTSLFLKWSYDYNIHIVLLLHQNKNDINPRGHIGSEVVNKAETIISVTKEDKNNIFRVVCEDSRDISFDDFGFTISEDGLPISSMIPETKQKKVTDPKYIYDEKHTSILNELFKMQLYYNNTHITKAISEKFGVGINIGKKYLNYYKDKGWLIGERDGMNVNYRLNLDMLHTFYNN